ncbi:uncharacterized protein CC84DRAFT_1159027 [Paraphaeosphaeria sporulosa]|uniref:Uncharacterized protein n=1 Tax=Paraphaeosphaeria sporulosa TaxID=1460663 RepID=A0A177CVE6_9PLEO|nr:uncharacterized protein CC84DRAFT_1159027 [Paraphaeosphaeria sporulosa]OAG11503.1 hypothetical protein CC84DRAFT_1159027 [Paraphaeosphaeria sporulosa]
MRQIASIAQPALLGCASQVLGGEHDLCRLLTNCMAARELEKALLCLTQPLMVMVTNRPRSLGCGWPAVRVLDFRQGRA